MTDSKECQISKSFTYFALIKLNFFIMKKNEFKIIINPLNKRNYGLDILRVISMINIINLHINGFSHMLNS